jgi:hypothetical protein
MCHTFCKSRRALCHLTETVCVTYCPWLYVFWKLTDSVCDLTHLTISQIIGIFQKVSGQDMPYLLQVKKGTLSSYRNCSPLLRAHQFLPMQQASTACPHICLMRSRIKWRLYQTTTGIKRSWQRTWW